MRLSYGSLEIGLLGRSGLASSSGEGTRLKHDGDGSTLCQEYNRRRKREGCLVFPKANYIKLYARVLSPPYISRFAREVLIMARKRAFQRRS